MLLFCDDDDKKVVDWNARLCELAKEDSPFKVAEGSMKFSKKRRNSSLNLSPVVSVIRSTPPKMEEFLRFL